jgi:hypothetical protein
MLKHFNQKPLAVIYGAAKNSLHSLQSHEGGSVAFNLMNFRGKVVGYYHVQQLASLHNIHLRVHN